MAGQGWWSRVQARSANGNGFMGTSFPKLTQLFGGQSNQGGQARAETGQNSPFFGAPTPRQLLSRMTGGNAQDQGLASSFNEQYGTLNPSFNERLNAQIWGNSSPSGQQDDPNDHPSQLRSSDGRVDVTSFSAQQSPSSIYQGQRGAATSLGGMGRTVGTATMGQVEDMLGAGIGRSDIASRLTQNREMSQNRDQARASGKRPAGMSAKDWIMQNS